TKHSVNMPSFVGSEPVSGYSDLGRHDRFEFVVRDFQEGQKFSNKYPDVCFVDQREAEIKSSPSNANIGIPQAFKNRVAVPLDSIGLHGHNLDESVECHVSDIVVPVSQEFTKDIDSEN